MLEWPTKYGPIFAQFPLRLCSVRNTALPFLLLLLPASLTHSPHHSPRFFSRVPFPPLADARRCSRTGCHCTALLVSAVGKECGLNFINIKVPELRNKCIGVGEKLVRALPSPLDVLHLLQYPIDLHPRALASPTYALPAGIRPQSHSSSGSIVTQTLMGSPQRWPDRTGQSTYNIYILVQI